MSGITVQLIFAFIGTRVPYHMSEPAAVVGNSPLANTAASSTSFSATAVSSLQVQSANSSPSLGPAAPTPHFTIHDLFTRLGKIVEPRHETRLPSLHDVSAAEAATEAPLRSGTSSPPPSAVVAHRAPLLEVFDYESMTPLDGAAILHDERVLLVLCDLPTSMELVEALQLEWMEVYSGTHRPHQPSRPLPAFPAAGATEMAVCTTEERLRNVAHAQMALCKPVPLHMHLLEKEFTDCEATLRDLARHLRAVKSEAGMPPSHDALKSAESGVLTTTSSGVMERFPLLVELEPSLKEVLEGDSENLHSASNTGSLLMVEHRVEVKEAVFTRVTKQLAKLKQLVFEEAEKEQDFSVGEQTQALQAHLELAEQDRESAEEIVKCFQAEMARQLKSVRFLVAHITHLRNMIKTTKREAITIDMVLDRLSMTLQRPRLLERAETLLRRRVVLRRAARRQLLLLQETEYADLLHDLQDFCQQTEVQKVLPAKVRWYLRAPLPSLQPAEDVVAKLLDQALIDRDVDAAQELVERTRVASPVFSGDAAETAQQITDALLPIERLVQRAEKAEREAALYKARVAELEEKLKAAHKPVEEASSSGLDTAETETFTGNGTEESPTS